MTAGTERAVDAGLIRPDRTYEGYVFDLDGTVYLGDDLLPGAAELIATLRADGRRTVFVSNNPTRNPQMYADKLGALGVVTPVADIVNPIVTMRHWLLTNHRDAGIFVIGEEPLREALQDAGLRLTDRPTEIDIVVASFDRTFDYRKLQIAFDAIWQHRRARLVTTNTDPYCPMPGGRGQPDAASVVAAIEACTGVRCEADLGKPGPLMLETVLAMLRLSVESCVMVGDRISTDVAMAVRAGMDSAVVLTGETTASSLTLVPAAQRPTWVLAGLAEILPESHGDSRG